ncbi:MAG: GNAT family N-acetyltransferase [Actinomycetota bacterium]
MRQPSPDHDRAAEVHELSVAPARFRQRIGSQLLAGVEAEIQASGFSAAILWVREDDRGAQAFYLSNGWTPDGAEMQLRKDRVRTYQRWGKALETEARG